MLERRRSELTPQLARAVQLLRETPPPRATWRAAVLDEIAATPDLRVAQDSEPAAPAKRRAAAVGTRWSLRPIAAIAACLACVALGAGAMAIVSQTRSNAATREVAMHSQGEGLAAAANAATLPVRFTLVAPSAAHVAIVGDFNRWDPISLPLRRSPDGKTWEVEVSLPPGRYSYSFVVDGRLARDPSAPQDTSDDFGSSNSILLLRGS